MAEPSAPSQPEPDVRFSLANERTLLAYQRTAIALLAAAVAIAHFFGDGVLVLVLAGALLVTAAIAAVGGYHQFRRVDAAVRSGQPVSSGPAAHALALAVVLCLVIGALYVVVAA